jgi:serine/threonine protein kinase
MPAGRQLVAGDVFAGYRIDGLRGRGAFGAVYVATDPHVGGNRQIALKIIDPAGGLGRADRPSELGAHAIAGRERFLREARALGGAHHPHIVPVFRAGEQDGLLYLAMPLLPGDLDEEITRRGTFPPAAAARVAGQIATALHTAHSRGIVHRDVKPANVLLYRDVDGQLHAYLADFGLAMQEGAARLTAAGDPAVGTPMYMAPEQRLGEPATPASDIHAAGLILHEMLLGVPRCPSASAPCHAPFDDPLVARLHTVARRACAPDPACRHRSAEELGRDLMAALGDTQLPAAVRPLASASNWSGGDAAPSLGPAGIPSWIPSDSAGAPSDPPVRTVPTGASTGGGQPAALPPPGRGRRVSRGAVAGALLGLAVALLATALYAGPSQLRDSVFSASDPTTADPASPQHPRPTAPTTTTASTAAATTPAPATPAPDATARQKAVAPPAFSLSPFGTPTPTPTPTATAPGAATRPSPLAVTRPPAGGSPASPGSPRAAPSATAAPAPPSPRPVTTAVVQRLTVCAQNATVRSTYGAGSTPIGVLVHGAEFDADGVSANGGSWIHGQAPAQGLTGWVLSEFVNASCSAA